jgi:hypothetical protein
MNFGPDFPDVLVEWYFTDRERLDTPTVFNSLNWIDRDYGTDQPLGELDADYARPWAPGRRPWQADGCELLGERDWFLTGVPAGTPARPPRVRQLDVGLGLRTGLQPFLKSWAFTEPRMKLDVSTAYVGSAIADAYYQLSAGAGYGSAALAAAELAAAYGAVARQEEDAVGRAAVMLHLETLVAQAESAAAAAVMLADLAGRLKMAELAHAGAALAVVLEADQGETAAAVGTAALAAGLRDVVQALGSALKAVASGDEADKGKATVSISTAAFQVVTPSGGCGSLPASLVARFAGGTGTCTCLNGQAVTLTWSSLNNSWLGSTANVCGGTSNCTLVCQAGTFHLKLSLRCISDISLSGTTGASPNLTGTAAVTVCCSGNISVTVTRT